MSERVFKEGDTVVLVNETGKQIRQVDYVTPSGIVVISEPDRASQRFRQDGTCTNNMGLAHIEHYPSVSQDEAMLQDIEQVKAHYAALLNEIIDGTDSLLKSVPLTNMTREVMILQRAECSEQIKEVTGFLSQVYAQLQALPLPEVGNEEK